MRLLRRHLRAQEGITLIMAIGILGVLSLTGATLIYYSTSNARSASASKGRETAYTLAEAGVAQALSVLNSSLNPLTGLAPLLDDAPARGRQRHVLGDALRRDLDDHGDRHGQEPDRRLRTSPARSRARPRSTA